MTTPVILAFALGLILGGYLVYERSRLTRSIERYAAMHERLVELHRYREQVEMRFRTVHQRVERIEKAVAQPDKGDPA